MDSVVLVMEPLTQEMIAGGAAMLAGLDAAGFPPQAAYWVWQTDRPQWLLTFVYPESRRADRSAISGHCRGLRENNPAFEESWDASYVTQFGESSIDPVTPALRGQSLRPGRDGKPVRVKSVYGKDVFVDFALIYRME